MSTLKLVTAIALSLFLPVVNSELAMLDGDTQDRIVYLHNEGRSDVLPEAANMHRMYWSEDLAKIAASHAQTCNPAPNENRHGLTRKFAVVGENIGLSFEVAKADIFTLIEYWFSEARFYDYETGTCGYFIEGYDTCSHYLEAVWAETCEVGCAIAQCDSQLPEDFSAAYLAYLDDADYLAGQTRYLVVCNYGPGNRDHAQRPYIEGGACSLCPSDYPLCTNSSDQGDGTRTRSSMPGGTRSTMTGGGTRSTMTGGGTRSTMTGGGTRSTMTGGGTRSTMTGGGTRSTMTGQGTRSTMTGQGTRSTMTGQGTRSTRSRNMGQPGEPRLPRDLNDDDDPRGQTGTSEQTGTSTRSMSGRTGTKGHPNGLCYNEEEMCLGSDPHFAIRLPGGQLLCYSFQGAHNTTFNLVSNRQLEMNALFVPDQTNWDNTWLGAIGTTVHHNGNTTTLKFMADDQLVKIGKASPIAARSIKKISIHKGRPVMVRIPLDHAPKYPRVQVELRDADLNFTVAFTKSRHLDLYWHSTGEPFEDSKGVVGQFFRHGVKVDVEGQLLHLPGRPAVPVEQKPLWKFTKHSFHRDTKCWTSLYASSQGAGIVEGSYTDYIVDRLLAVEL